ncbi:MAG: hypothetical protein ACLSG5_01365 [Oscillospiraceae bacterium]
MNGKIFTVRLSADENAVEILDQTLLPNRVEYLRLETAEQLYEAIFKLRVRGAPAIGVCAGFECTSWLGKYGRYSAGAPQGGGVPRFVAANRSKSELGCKTNASLRGTRL